MRVAFSKLEWGGIALLVAGPVLNLTGNQLALRECSRGSDQHREMLRVVGLATSTTDSDLTRTDNLARALEVARRKSSDMLSHYSRTISYKYAANVGFTLFLLGIALFLIGGRRRSLTAKLNSTGIHTRAEPSDGSDAATPNEGEGRLESEEE